MAHDMSIFSNRNCAGFFTDHHNQGITLFRQADGSPVPGAKLRGQTPVFRQRQQTACGNQTVAADNAGPVMQRRIDDKHIQQKFCRNQPIYLNAGIADIVQPHIAFNDQQSARLSGRQLLYRLGNLGDYFFGLFII